MLSTCEITELLRTLVNHGADVNCRGPDNKTALQAAAGKDNWETVGTLIQLGGVCELTPDEKLSALTLLHLCISKDVDDEKIKVFIKYITNDGSNINNSFQEKNRCGDQKTFLQNCIEKSNWRMAKALVECGAHLSQKDTNEPILQIMVSRYSERDHSSWVSFLDYLISRGLDIKSKLREGSGILFHDKIVSSLTCKEKVTECLFDTLLERGADPLVVDSKGQTLLRKVLDFGEKPALNALKKLLPIGVTTHQPKFTETIVQSHGGSSKQTVSPMEKIVLIKVYHWLLSLITRSSQK
ncbi:hypothetical protein C0Q70_04753 [Pomacea canaliculata]|uniref:Uncharacterized protein n=1 Tax=Pomacea canaliculata TaxID=400727 RepID=A0A2T7PJB0_POMCA|nr:hypothetical protein C0Q70_04753 [Pomacea canaliculata]